MCHFSLTMNWVQTQLLLKHPCSIIKSEIHLSFFNVRSSTYLCLIFWKNTIINTDLKSIIPITINQTKITIKEKESKNTVDPALDQIIYIENLTVMSSFQLKQHSFHTLFSLFPRKEKKNELRTIRTKNIPCC